MSLTNDGDDFPLHKIEQTEPTKEELLAEIARLRAEVKECHALIARLSADTAP